MDFMIRKIKASAKLEYKNSTGNDKNNNPSREYYYLFRKTLNE